MQWTVTRDPICLYLEHGFAGSRIVNDKFLLLKPPSTWNFVLAVHMNWNR